MKDFRTTIAASVLALSAANIPSHAIAPLGTTHISVEHLIPRNSTNEGRISTQLEKSDSASSIRPSPLGGRSQKTDVRILQESINNSDTLQLAKDSDSSSGIGLERYLEMIDNRAQAIDALKTNLGQEQYDTLVQQGFSFQHAQVQSNEACVWKRNEEKELSEIVCWVIDEKIVKHGVFTSDGITWDLP